MIEAMQHFVQVVETGSFSNASKRLSKNASSVARQIDKLEQELGTPLFSRSTRRLELTLAGQSFYQQSLDILSAIHEAKQSVKQGCTEVRGTVAVSVLDSFGRQKIAPLLPRFCALYPHARAALSLDNTVVDLYQSHFDLAIRYGKPADSNLIMKPLLRDRTRLVASPSYLAQHPEIRHPEDLKRHNCLTFHRQRQHTFWYFQQDARQQKIRVNGSLSSCGGEPMVAWAREGLGITLMSQWIIDADLQAGNLVEVLPEWRASLTEANASNIYMVWTPTAAQKPVVRCLIDFLFDHIVGK